MYNYIKNFCLFLSTNYVSSGYYDDNKDFTFFMDFFESVAPKHWDSVFVKLFNITNADIRKMFSPLPHKLLVKKIETLLSSSFIAFDYTITIV